jgi:hypothetical protein
MAKGRNQKRKKGCSEAVSGNPGKWRSGERKKTSGSVKESREKRAETVREREWRNYVEETEANGEKRHNKFGREREGCPGVGERQSVCIKKEREGTMLDFLWRIWVNFSDICHWT